MDEEECRLEQFHRTVETLIIELVVEEFTKLNKTLARIERNQRRTLMTLEERFNAVSTKLDEASAEILAEIATLKSQPLTPEQEAALANIEAKANALGDIAPPIPPQP